jgi:serine/threonine protein kinase
VFYHSKAEPEPPLKKLGKYEVLRELGHGAMGVVYRARDPVINRLVALKTITARVADDPALLERFLREAQAAGALQHPNIVVIYEVGTEGALPYIAMELVEGENLEQVIARRSALPITLKLVYAVQACRALDYAHKRGIVHGDIRPGNVMVSKEGVVKVVDFGIARITDTETGMLIGNLGYMSPEQYHGGHADQQSDIWSLGVFLYELLAYQRPFAGPTTASLVQAICNEEPTPLGKILPECPKELEAVVSIMLRKSRTERYQSMEDVLLDLDPVCKTLQSQSVADLAEQAQQRLKHSRVRNLELHEVLVKTLPSPLEKAEYRDVQTILVDRQKSEEAQLIKNLGDKFLLRSFELKNVRFFEDCTYEFRPRVNVLLGRNGYGKTLLLRTLAATIQCDLENGGLLFPVQTRSSSAAAQSDKAPFVRLHVERNEEPEETVRDPIYFRKTTGRIPLLAIPDLRFMNRQVKVFAPPAIVPEPLSRSGARHFITQEPYENKVLELLYTLCLDYNESGKSFRPPIFRLVEQVVRDLTEDQSFAFHAINRVKGTTGYEILVKAEGTEKEPMPIQRASQGTLSVLVIFGQIFYFLGTLRPNITDDIIFQLSGIVLIDEIDAHLHPFWQQKILGMLTTYFPNVQFIVSAHSPLVVAGSDRKEVAVLRRSPAGDRFRVEVLEQDFLGAQPQELYKLIFEIDDMDRLYLEYSAKVAAGTGLTVKQQIEHLEKKSRRTLDEQTRLEALVREDRLLQRAAEVRETRLESVATQARIEKLEDEIERLQDELRRRSGGTA